MRLGERNEFSHVEELNFAPVSAEKPTLHGELTKIRTLGWNYFWSYYKWWTIGLIVCLFAGGIMARDIVRNKRPYTLSGAVYNYKTGGGEDMFAENLAAYMGVDLKKEPVKIQSGLKCGTGSAHSEEEYAAEMKLEAKISARELDFIIADEQLMESLCGHTGNASYLADLREALPEELYEQAEEKMLWYKTSQGEEIPVVMDITGSKLDEALAFEEKPVYLGILANAQHMENAAKMLEYIMMQE